MADSTPSDVPQDPPAPQWPNTKEDYELLDVIGSGATAVVQVARCVKNNMKVAIKRIDLERCGSTIEELQKEISLMSHCNHPNVIAYYTSFVVKHELWLVMKLMSGGSLLDIIKHLVAKGAKGGVLDETVIATILKEVLLGLEYFHSNKQIHRDVKAGNILIGEDGSVQLADFGVSSWLYDTSSLPASARQKAQRFTFVGTPCWMAPEVMDQSVGYNEKADIWSLGITALELATGTAPYAKFPPMKVLMLTMENPSPTLETCGDLNGDDYRKNYSKSFQKFVEKCLLRDPDKRPSASELLKLPFFKKAKNKEFIKEVVLGGAPSLQSRARQVKRRPGASGRLHRTEEGGWVWSDDEMTEEYEAGAGGEDDKEKPKTAEREEGKKTTSDAAKPTDSGSSQLQVPTSEGVATSTPSSAQPPQTSGAPVIQVGDRGRSGSADISALQQQSQVIQTSINDVEQQLLLARQQHKQISLDQQISGLPTAEQNTQAKQLEERMKSLEGRRQQLEQQQVVIIQQLRALQTMEKQFQEAVKIQGQSGATTGVVIKLVLRKRTEQNQLKDIKFDYVCGSDSADAISKDLVEAGLVDGRNMVVVAANIQKLVENPSAKKVIFPVASSQTQDKWDEKNLIGYAQLSRSNPTPS